MHGQGHTPHTAPPSIRRAALNITDAERAADSAKSKHR